MEPLPRPVDGDRDRGPQLLAMWWTELSICIVMVAMRFYSRYKLKNFGLDDWLMLTALVLYVSTTVAEHFAVVSGGGRHLYYLNPAQTQLVIKVTWIENPLGIMALAIAKMSVAFLILRLIGPSTRWRRWSLYLSIVLTFIIGALSCILTFAQCNPPRALWEPTEVPEAKCWKPSVQSNFAIFSGAYYTFIDMYLALIPVTFIWNLNLKRQRKIALSMLLSLGVFASICSAVKVGYLHELSSRADFTWATYDLAAWTGAEIFLLIFCACVPTLKPVYDLMREHALLGLAYLSSKSYGGSHRKSYQGFDTDQEASSYGVRSDQDSPRHTTNSADKAAGVSTVITAQPKSKSNPWHHEDGNGLIEMSVMQESGLESNPASHPGGRQALFGREQIRDSSFV